MNCPEIRAALPDLLYGELKPALVETVQSHLAGCAGCQAELAALRQVTGLLDKLPVLKRRLMAHALGRTFEKN